MTSTRERTKLYGQLEDIQRQGRMPMVAGKKFIIDFVNIGNAGNAADTTNPRISLTTIIAR